MEDERLIRAKMGSEATSPKRSLKVGLHEWIVVDLTVNNPIELWTSGLSGCVGVAIVTPTRAFVTHISSEIAKDGWEKTVKGEFLSAIEKMADINLATACKVVGGQDEELFTVILESVKGTMNNKTNGKCEISCAKLKSGVTVRLESGKPCIIVISSLRDEPPFIGTLNSETGAGYCKAQGFFTSAKAYRADLGKD